MKGLVIGLSGSELREGLSVLETLSNVTGSNVEKYAVLVSSNPEKVKGFDKLYVVKSGSIYTSFQSVLKIVSDVAPEVIVAVNMKDCVDLMSRVAASTNRFMVTEVALITKNGSDVYLARPILGGRALAYYKFTNGIAFTVAKGKFQPIEGQEEPEVIEVAPEANGYEVLGVEEKKRGAVDIESADIVVGVGRGFKAKEDLAMASELAHILGGEVGCSRPIAADFGWLDEDRWIGISGKKIRPKLYLPIGISGAPQHIMAANDSKIIVAVNKDKNAPIFNYSDYGVVADLYQFIPALIKVLKERLKK